MSDVAAPACSLEGRAFHDRVRWIADLNRRFLHRKSQVGLTLTLVYAMEASAQVQELVRQERECCAALDFTAQATGNEIALHITVPTHAADRAQVLLQPFHGDETTHATSCCGECGKPA